MIEGRRLTIAALGLVAALWPGFAAAGTTYKTTVAEFVEMRDWTGLRAYLAARPELLVGGAPDAVELRRFMGETSGLYAALTLTPASFPVLAPDMSEKLVARPIRRPMRITDIVTVAKRDSANRVRKNRVVRKKAAKPRAPVKKAAVMVASDSAKRPASVWRVRTEQERVCD